MLASTRTVPEDRQEQEREALHLRLIGVVECLTLLCSAPFLMFPGLYPRATIDAFVGLGLVTTAGMILRRAWRVPTPLFWPALVLGIMVLVGTAISPARVVSLPKLCGVVLGMLVARMLVLAVRNERQLWFAVLLYFVFGAGIIALGAIGTNWIWGSKIPWISARVSEIPTLVHLPGAENGINPNGLGGTILLFFPLLTCIVLAHAREWWRRDPARAAGQRGVPFALAFGVLMLCCLAILLLMTQSRTSWVSLLVTGTFIVGLWWRERTWARYVGFALTLVFVAAVVRPVSRLNEERAGHVVVPISREALWAKGLDDLRHSPWVGIGLNVFRTSIKIPPRPPGPPADLDIAHVHNVFLQTALDTGLPGLVAYLALLGLAGGMALRNSRGSDPKSTALALGLLGNLMAVHLFGLTDAIVLGAKSGLFLWWTMGLIAAFDRVSTYRSDPHPAVRGECA